MAWKLMGSDDTHTIGAFILGGRLCNRVHSEAAANSSVWDRTGPASKKVIYSNFFFTQLDRFDLERGCL